MNQLESERPISRTPIPPLRGRAGRLPTRHLGKDGSTEAWRRGTGSGEAADDDDEERAVTAVVGPTVRTARQMPVEGRSLFRRKLAVQIFPQSPCDLGTLH